MRNLVHSRADFPFWGRESDGTAVICTCGWDGRPAASTRALSEHPPDVGV